MSHGCDAATSHAWAAGFRPAHRVRLGRLRGPLVGASVSVIGLALAFPIASLLWWFVTGLSAGIDTSRLVESIAATAWLALLGAIACTLGAVPVGILVARHRGRFTSVIEQVTYAGHALPGIVVALALVFLGVRVVPRAYQEAPLLVLAYVVLFLPTAVGSVRSSVGQSRCAARRWRARSGRRPSRCCVASRSRSPPPASARARRWCSSPA